MCWSCLAGCECYVNSQMSVDGRDFIRRLFTYPEIEVADSASDVKVLVIKANDLIHNISSTADTQRFCCSEC